ncbi:hypothetical protein [Mycobacterium canetti]|uniref:hypothetical protein n=1 Tax=Mycobacterium canetti TaxID=78331 RepID=UPI0002A5BA9C|nr:hypothetical protein [Mycobacterium canetti]CCK59357.1 Protein of unknown function [Mycobacterium canettii CIPT 140070010]
MTTVHFALVRGARYRVTFPASAPRVAALIGRSAPEYTQTWTGPARCLLDADWALPVARVLARHGHTAIGLGPPIDARREQRQRQLEAIRRACAQAVMAHSLSDQESLEALLALAVDEAMAHCYDGDPIGDVWRGDDGVC